MTRFAMVGLLGLLLVVPGVHAQAGEIRVRVVPEDATPETRPSEKVETNLRVSVEFRDTNCQRSTSVAVSLMFREAFPTWAGASVYPDSGRYRYPGETKDAALEMLPAEDAPPAAKVTYRIQPSVRTPNGTECPATPRFDAPSVNVTLTILEPSREGAGTTSGGGGASPGVGVAGWVLGSGLVLAWRRRLA